jgi:hypothetical protein
MTAALVDVVTMGHDLSSPHRRSFDVRRIALATLAASLLLAGCGGSDSDGGGLGDVKVSKSASPKVTVAKGFTAK